MMMMMMTILYFSSRKLTLLVIICALLCIAQRVRDARCRYNCSLFLNNASSEIKLICKKYSANVNNIYTCIRRAASGT